MPTTMCRRRWSWGSSVLIGRSCIPFSRRLTQTRPHQLLASVRILRWGRCTFDRIFALRGTAADRPSYELGSSYVAVRRVPCHQVHG